MKKLFIASAALGLLTTAALGQADRLAIQSQPAHDGTPAWHLGPSFPDPTGFTLVDADGTVTVIPRDQRGPRMRVPGGDSGPQCSHSPVCGRKGGFARSQLARVEWDQTMGYQFSYPYVMPKGIGGLPSVALDSKGYLWAFKRSPAGVVQLMKFAPDHKLVLEVPESVIGHQDKAHGMAVDRDDNVWITDNGQATVMKLSPDGKLLKTFGTRLHRGDWDEARNQRLLWQPMDVAFAPNGDVYIGEGHSNESPNDVESPDPTNVIGAARVLHFARDGNFVNQWFGNAVGQGKFSMAHGVAVDPKNGDVWIGDREQYRIVVYTKDGHFLKTMQMRNLICAIDFDAAGNPWVASGQDGQILRIDRNGKVLGAMGNGAGRDPGQAIETTYMAWDKDGNIYTGDTSVGRVTKWSKPKKK
jgi:DNA-binding beta-propeller fold protein YncE